MTQKRKRPQAQKSRSTLTKAMLVENRARVFTPDSAYKRKPKHGKVYDLD